MGEIKSLTKSEEARDTTVGDKDTIKYYIRWYGFLEETDRISNNIIRIGSRPGVVDSLVTVAEHEDKTLKDLRLESLTDDNRHNTVYSVLKYPLKNMEMIMQRQDSIRELVDNPLLLSKTKEICRLAIKYTEEKRKDPRYNDYMCLIDNVSNLVDVLDAMRDIDGKSWFFEKLRHFEKTISRDEDCSETIGFYREIYHNQGLKLLFSTLQRYDKFNHVKIDEWDGDLNIRRTILQNGSLLEKTLDNILAKEPHTDFIPEDHWMLEYAQKTKETMQKIREEFFTQEQNDSEFRGFWGAKYAEIYDRMQYLATLIGRKTRDVFYDVLLENMVRDINFMTFFADYANDLKGHALPCVFPKILPKEERRFEIHDAHNIVQVQRILNNERGYRDIEEMKSIREMFSSQSVPNDIISYDWQNIFVITGPNNCGKSTYLRTVGQHVWLALLGAPVPATSSEVSIVDNIGTVFSRGDTDNEGTYAEMIRQLEPYLNDATEPEHIYAITQHSLLLLDEFTNGTDFNEAIQATKEVLDYISSVGATTYFTTHLHPIAEMNKLGKISNGLNLATKRVDFEGKSYPTYKIIRDAHEQSHGDIVRKMYGLTKEHLDSLKHKKQ